MNPHTNQIIHLDHDPIERMRQLASGFQELPQELQRAARIKLAGRPEATVSRTSGGQLCNWARKQRKMANRKRMAEASRRRNRK